MPKIVSGFSALVLSVVVASPATAAIDRHYMGSSCNYEYDQNAAHKRQLHKFVNTSEEARSVTCPVVAESNVSVKWATMEFKAPVTAMRVEHRYPDGTLLGWTPDREVYINSDGSLRRAEWFVNGDTGAYSDHAWAFSANVGPGGFIVKYGMEQ
jgi:hypothetical protein